MNRQRILTLAAHLETLPPDQFSMLEWHEESHCGTVACIAGWATTLFTGDYPGDWDCMIVAARELGIADEAMIEQLFIPDPHPDVDVYDLTGIEAARVLRHLAATGELDWRQAKEVAR